ncbi:hypothetical protein QFZ82_001538 [Streptomyces sp. V4I23]|nr:hypothetical protein [Streptomyces sp. V4I23]
MLAFGQRVDLGGDLEVGEAAAERSAVVGEGLVLADVNGGGRQAGQVGVHEADLQVGEVHGGVLEPGRPEALERGPAEHPVVALVRVHRRELHGEVGPRRDADDCARGRLTLREQAQRQHHREGAADRVAGVPMFFGS